MLANTWNIQNVVIPGFPSTNNLPQVQFGTGPTAGGSTYKPLTFRDVNLSFVEALTWTRGRHNAKFGYEYRHLNSHPNFSLFPTPYWYFGGPGQALTSDPDYGFYDPNSLYYNGGSEIADLLLGVPEVAYQGLQLTNASTTANEHSFYLQDYWQVTPKVNITYGLRYEYQQPYVEANNNEANFDINTLLINLAGRGGNPRSLVNSNTKDFMPRVGLSYQLLPTWVLRAGFGIFYSPENDAREDILTKNYPFFTQQAFYNSDYYIGYILDSGSPRSTSITIPSGASSIDDKSSRRQFSDRVLRANRLSNCILAELQPDSRETVGKSHFSRNRLCRCEHAEPVLFGGQLQRQQSPFVGDRKCSGIDAERLQQLRLSPGQDQSQLPERVQHPRLLHLRAWAR